MLDRESNPYDIFAARPVAGMAGNVITRFLSAINGANVRKPLDRVMMIHSMWIAAVAAGFVYDRSIDIE